MSEDISRQDPCVVGGLRRKDQWIFFWVHAEREDGGEKNKQ